ncbi:MAG: SAM-dependent methyltransferase [Crenarchaeota archaeon]|nr:SAM-dependent methyltransferase [Thermoproteota archaeon]
MSEVPFVPTPLEVIDEMLRLCDPRPGKIVVDPGCGDGRILIRAAERFNMFGIGIEKLEGLVKRCLREIRKRGLLGKILIVHDDIFNFNYSIADIVTLYLGSDVNERLRPKLERELRPGTRVVSHDFEVPGWRPVKVVKVRGPNREHTLYLYIMK